MKERINSAEFYDELLAKALREIDEKHGGKAILVSAEMRVDGTSQLRNENLQRVTAIITKLRSQGKQVFDQIPWLDINIDGAPRDYAVKFEKFWKGLIQSGRIGEVVAVEESLNARGVQSEIAYATERGIAVTISKLADLLEP